MVMTCVVLGSEDLIVSAYTFSVATAKATQVSYMEIKESRSKP